MAGRLAGTLQIREKLRATIASERREILFFSVLTILLTPVFIALSVVVLLLALHETDPRPALWDEATLVHAVVLFLGSSVAMFFIRPGVSWRDGLWLAAGLAAFGLLLHLSYGKPLRQENPSLFWPLFAGSAMLMLGLLGRGYVPRDHCFVRPGEWDITDSPFERHAQRVDFWLGFAVAFPRLILGSYGDIFGSGWLWRGMGDRGLRTAADVLHALGSHDPRSAEQKLRALPAAEGGRVVRWLLRLKLLRKEGGRLGLGSEGERFLGISQWTV
jgi:hypothetical protein